MTGAAETVGLHLVAGEDDETEAEPDSLGVLFFVPLRATVGHSTVIALAETQLT